MKLKPIVAAAMTGAVLVGTMAQPAFTFAADAVDLNSMTLDDITAKSKRRRRCRICPVCRIPGQTGTDMAGP